jgi:hypothetical protein
MMRVTTLLLAMGVASYSPMLEGKSVPAVAEQSSLTHVYGAFWELGNGYSSTVVLKNNDSQNAIAANIVIFSHTGQQELVLEGEQSLRASERPFRDVGF